MRLSTKAGTQTIAAADIGRVQWQKPDSSLTGALIGGAIGADPWRLLADR